MKRLMFQWTCLMSLLLVTQLACAQAVRPPTAKEAKIDPPITRTVKGQVLASAATPAVKLEFDKRFKYVGSQSLG